MKKKFGKVITPEGYYYIDEQGNIYDKESIEGYPVPNNHY